MTLKQQVNQSKMPSVVAAQPEKPGHYTYLKSFRTEQCKEFLQHRCKQHRPFTCFNWHFPNQRRRRSIRKRDGSFNYSANVYCAQYDESNGSCPDGESCPLLHRNVGDTERHYHLRYFKTEQCAHSLNSSGHCSKNGPHCMFAHGPDDCRKPVFDITEPESSGSGINVGLTGGDKYADQLEDKSSSLDPKWNDPQYVAAHYKTERCPKWSPTQSTRMCRQGLMCPYYHSSKDRRRNFASMKYRSIACPMVKNKDDWGDPEDCDRGDSCAYCHTRMELQYHPDVYRSLKCEMMNKNGQCVKGIFCAFLHIDGDNTGSQESLSEERFLKSTDSSISSVNKPANGSPSSQVWNSSDSGHGLSDISFPSSKVHGNSDQLVPFSGIKLRPASISPMGASELSKLPSAGMDLAKLPPGSEFPGGNSGFPRSSEQFNGFALAPGAELSNGKVQESMLLGNAMYRHPTAFRELWLQQSMSGLKVGDTGPVGFPPAPVVPQLRGPMHADTVERSRRHQILLQQAAHTRTSLLSGSVLKMDESLKLNSINGSMTSTGIRMNEGNTLDKLDFDFDHKDMGKSSLSIDASSPARSFSSSEFSPSSAPGVIGQISNANGHTLLESPDDVKSAVDSMFFPSAFDQSSNIQQMLVRMRMELDMTRRRLEMCDEEKRQIAAERDKALEQVAKCRAEDSSSYGEGRYLRCLHPLSNLNDLSVPLLQQIETQLKSDLQRIKSIILDKAGGKCLNCLEKNASLRLPICHHKVLCEVCYMKTNECPSCQAAITSPQ